MENKAHKAAQERYPMSEYGYGKSERQGLCEGYEDCYKERVEPLEKDVVRLKQALAEAGGRSVKQMELIQDLVNALSDDSIKEDALLLAKENGFQPQT